MIHQKIFTPYFIVIGIVLTALTVSPAVTAQAATQPEDKKADIIAQVKGLSCPFCAYGLEKKLRKLPGVESVKVNMDEALALVNLKEGASPPSRKVIKKTVKDAGFQLSEFQSHPDLN